MFTSTDERIQENQTLYLFYNTFPGVTSSAIMSRDTSIPVSK